MGVDYFTMWIEAEVVATITTYQGYKSYWEKLMCNYYFLQCIFSNYGTYFANSIVVDFCKKFGIHNMFTLVEHSQGNG